MARTEARNKRASWRLGELSLKEVRESPPELVVLPFGAIEPHGMHLPYGFDVRVVDAIADRACELAAGQGTGVVRLPVFPFGCQTTQSEFPFALNVYPSTLRMVLRDLIEALDRSDIRKAVLLNGHGGNDFYPDIRELFGRFGVHVTQVNYYEIAGDLRREIFRDEGDHANEWCTSLMLHLCPELVEMDDAGPQPISLSRISGLESQWARAPRPWHLYTLDSGAGDPRGADAEKGAQFFDAIVNELAEFFVEMAAAPFDERFPFDEPRDHG